MDFGALGLDRHVGPESSSVACAHVSAAETRQKFHGSERPLDFSVPKAMAAWQQNNPLISSGFTVTTESHPQERMLSFSSSNKETAKFTSTLDGRLVGRNPLNNTPAVKSTEVSQRGPFTASQWAELEHQALIYKYIAANVAVPPSLALLFKKSLYPFGLSCSSSGSFTPNSLGWGAFHLGCSSNPTDPEPGRCRRTDGKKWRCSRDAVTDQKYCERHINRGRHRSRKPVEGQTGHAVACSTTPMAVPVETTMPTSSLTTSNGATNNLPLVQERFRIMQAAAAHPRSLDPTIKGEQGGGGVSDPMIGLDDQLRSNESFFVIPKQSFSMEFEHPEWQFGRVTRDSLMNPSQHGSYAETKCYETFMSFNGEEGAQDHPHHLLHQFMEDWPKDSTSRPGVAWNKELKPDWTQLSMSIPMESSDFSSSTSSPSNEKPALSPLRLHREFDPSETGLDLSNEFNEVCPNQTPFMPILGGPLGEALKTSSENMRSCGNASALNLLNEVWYGSSMGSSPTGVLQKSTLVSLSSSSGGSSPPADSKKNDSGGRLCDDLFG